MSANGGRVQLGVDPDDFQVRHDVVEQVSGSARPQAAPSERV
jgi:hypothetical protein